MPQSQILKAQRFFLLAALLLYLLSTQVFSQITPDPSSLTPSPATLLRTGLVHLTDEEKAWLNQRNGVIRLAPDPFFPPLEWFDEQGEYRGFVADCFKMIEARLGAKIEVIRCRTWDEVLEKAKRHEIDGITAAQITPERRAYLAFTPSLIDIPNVIIMRRDAEGPLEFSRMKGMSIVVTRGNALHEYLGRKHPDVNLLLKDDDLTCLQDVSFGRADATVINLAIAAWLIEKHGISNLRVVGDSGKTNQLAIACRIDQPLMLSIMEKGLASISDAERREIYKKWVILDRVESIPSEEFWRLLRYAAMILTAVLTVFYIWNRTLQRQVALRTDELKAELIARQGAEKALVEEKERLAVTLTSIGEGVVTTDIAGRVTLMNRIAAELTGWPQHEALNTPLQEILPVRLSLSAGRSVADMVDRSGRTLRISSTTAPILDGHKEQIGMVIVFQDITAQEEIERELQRAQKLESLGLLAGGIAHDFNNIFTGILGHISLARATMDRASEAFTMLDEAESSISTARGLTRQLLTFARGGAPQKRLQSVKGLLQDSVKLVLTGSSVRLALQVPDNLWNVEVDEGQLGQALQNLVLNARQSMHAGGRIEVSAANRILPDPSRQERMVSVMQKGASLPAGRYVEIAVSDEGCGITPENLPRLFDPFFTTKPQGHGLGLPTVFSIVEQHGGHITVDSTPDEGSVFRIYLPASEKQIPAKEAGIPAQIEGDGRILVMDDEKPILSVMRGILEHLGFKVTGVQEGSAALEEYKKSVTEHNPFRLAILDLTIRGGLGGLETARMLHELDPHLRIIVASGYSSDPIMSNCTAYGFCASLSKPFTFSDVEKTLKTVFKKLPQDIRA